MGPVFVGSIYTRLGTYWTFGLTSVMMLVSMIWLLLSRKRLIPPIYDTATAAADPVELKDLKKTDIEQNGMSSVGAAIATGNLSTLPYIDEAEATDDKQIGVSAEGHEEMSHLLNAKNATIVAIGRSSDT